MDRTCFTPRHEGDLVLPCNSLFTRMLILANQSDRQIAIRDLNINVEGTAADLLSDALHLRRQLRARLPANVIQDLKDGKETYISLLAPGGYEFTVAILAILALGAAVSPLSTAQPVHETTYYANKARSSIVLVSASALVQGQSLEKAIKSTTNPSFQCIPISINSKPAIHPSTLTISSSGYTSPNAPALVIFTSGTTGPPKGAVLRFASISDGALSFASQLHLSPSDTLLHLLPVHHATGIWVSFFPFLLSGSCIEFKPGPFSPKWTWDRWKQQGDRQLTYFTGVPTIYMRMMRYYEQDLQKLPNSQQIEYEMAAKRFKCCMCGTSALPKPINDFWTKILGRRIVQRYGSTELGVVFNMPFTNNEDVPDGSVGEVTLGVDVKLSPDSDNDNNTKTDNPHQQSTDKDPKEDTITGEILTRSFNMFSHYLHDATATRASHDAEGYFKSGDIATKKGKYYFIVGRASVDIIKSGGYKISALDVEREILALPYIDEVMVVGVPDQEFGQRVGAVVSLLRHRDCDRDRDSEHDRESNKSSSDEIKKGNVSSGLPSLTIEDLRSDLRERLAGYKLPTLLRVIRDELPKSGTGKVVKKILGPRYFTEDYVHDVEVQVWRRSMGMGMDGQPGKARL